SLALNTLETGAAEHSDMKSASDHGALAFHNLELRDVDYHYSGAKAPSLSNVSLTVHRGEHIGIVGSTGAGKSTLINVMLGLLDPTNGRVLVGEEDLRQVRPRWQRMIGYVPQSI